MENMARLIDITNCTSIIYALIRKAISTFLVSCMGIGVPIRYRNTLESLGFRVTSISRVITGNISYFFNRKQCPSSTIIIDTS